MGRPRKTDQEAIASARRLALRILADLQTHGRRLLFIAPSWSDEAFALRTTRSAEVPYHFHPVPYYLLLVEVTLADPKAPPWLARALKELASQGHVECRPIPLTGHSDFACRRPSGEILYVRVSPEDGRADLALHANWPPAPNARPLHRYVVPLHGEDSDLAWGYRLTPAGLAMPEMPEAPAAPAAATQLALAGDDNLTPRQVAERYRMDVDKVYDMIRSGQLPAVDVSSRPGSRKPRYRIRRQDLEAFEASRATQPPPARPSRKTGHDEDDDRIRFFPE